MFVLIKTDKLLHLQYNHSPHSSQYAVEKMKLLVLL